MSEEKNSNVVVIQDNGEKKTNKLTGEKWIKGIVKHKWCVIGTTLITGVICFAGVNWGVNALTEKLNASYTYNLATEVDENNVERYVNGKLFDYASVVSRTRMQAIKDSDEEFKRINIDKIIKNNAISVTRNVNFDTDANDKNVTSTKTISYTINAKARFFPNKEVGKRFIEKLIYLPLQDSTDSINSYNVTSFITASFDELSYLDKVNLLEKQYNEINTTYLELDEKFGGHVSANTDGQTLNQLYSDFIYSNSNVLTLVNSLYAHGYVDYEAGHENERIAEIKANADALVVSLKAKTKELKTLNELMERLQNITTISTVEEESELIKEIIKIKGEIVDASNEITGLIKVLNWSGYYENAEGEYVFDDTDTKNACYQLKTLDPTWVANNAKYANDITASASALEIERNEATQVFRYVYIFFNNGLSILNSGYVELKGSVHWSIGLIGGLLLGFVASSLIMAEYTISKEKQESEKEENK